MITISSLKPVHSSNQILIGSIRKLYFNTIHSVGTKNPRDEIRNAIVTGRLYKLRLTPHHVRLLRQVESSYPQLIKGSPDTHQKFINKITRAGLDGLCYSGKKSTTFGKKLLQAFGYRTRFRSVQEKGLWLANMLNIKTCPYCNSQYTLVVRRKDGEDLAKFQFDHFYSKDKYPFLSISLFNLIPSCASCNHRKSNEVMNLKKHYHPYYNDLSSISKFKIKYPANPRKLTLKQALAMNPQNIKIDFVSRFRETKTFVEDHNAIYDVDLIYKRHTDVAHEILIKAILQNRYYQRSIMKIAHLFPDRKTLLRYLLGNYIEEENINLRPLSKFTRDTARYLKLLK